MLSKCIDIHRWLKNDDNVKGYKIREGDGYFPLKYKRKSVFTVGIVFIINIFYLEKDKMGQDRHGFCLCLSFRKILELTGRERERMKWTDGLWWDMFVPVSVCCLNDACKNVSNRLI